MRPNSRYTYENAGFNTFMLRSMKSNPGAQTVRGGISVGSGKPMSFDRQALAGAIGDKLAIGQRLILDGNAGRVIVLDATGSTEIGWLGDLTS